VPQTNQDGVRVTLVIDGKTAWQEESSGVVAINASFTTIEFLKPGSTVDLRSHPKGGCHHDTHFVYLSIDALDCNGDGIADYSQILDGTLADVNNNGIPDICECVADLNADGVVNGFDLGLVLAVWGQPPALFPAADINGDGVVDGSDLALLLSNWGSCP
jgi:hypothetical protein